MAGFFSYFLMQAKRAGKTLPVILAAAFLTCVCLGACVLLYLREGSYAQEQRKFRIGLVGDISDTYLGFGIYALQSLDDSRFMVEFCSMEEQEARKQLRERELTTYLRIPDGFVDSLVSGRNDRPVTFFYGGGQRGIEGILAEKLAEEVSGLISDSQSAIYGMQRILADNGKSEYLWEATDSLNLRLIDVVLNRTSLCNLEELGISDGLSVEGYYLTALLIFFFLIMGIYHSSLFARKSTALSRLVKAKGVGSLSQVLGEYLAYVGVNILCMAEVFLLLRLPVTKGYLQVEEWNGMGELYLSDFFWSLLPVMAMLSAMQFLLYELTEGVVSGVLLQFVSSIAMAYLAGCFYPGSILPETLRLIGRALPAGTALWYAQAQLKEAPRAAAGIAVYFYLILFLALSAAVRKYRMERVE